MRFPFKKKANILEKGRAKREGNLDGIRLVSRTRGGVSARRRAVGHLWELAENMLGMPRSSVIYLSYVYNSFTGVTAGRSVVAAGERKCLCLKAREIRSAQSKSVYTGSTLADIKKEFHCYSTEVLITVHQGRRILVGPR